MTPTPTVFATATVTATAVYNYLASQVTAGQVAGSDAFLWGFPLLLALAATGLLISFIKSL